MTDIKPHALVLFHTPGACSRVTMNALEEIGLAFEDPPIDIFKGAQRRPDFLAVNPKGKVPALLVDGTLLTETPAILAWLIAEYPDANLMPAGDSLARATAFADLVWCSNTLHPLARVIRMPQRATLGDPEPVRVSAIEQVTPMLIAMQHRFEAQPWWFGQDGRYSTFISPGFRACASGPASISARMVRCWRIWRGCVNGLASSARWHASNMRWIRPGSCFRAVSSSTKTSGANRSSESKQFFKKRTKKLLRLGLTLPDKSATAT